MAPHLIRPLRFVLPLDAASRSPIVLRLGLFIYDLIGRREILPGTRSARSRHRCEAGAAAEAAFPSRLRIFRLLCRRCASRRAQRGRRRRTRRRDPHAHALRARRARRCVAAYSQCARRARRRDRAGAGQRGRCLGRDGRRDRAAADAAAAAAARQGQPHRGAASLRSRPRLHFAGGRRPGRVRHSVSARLHADRHDRSEFFRRSGRGRADRSEEIDYLCGVVNEYFRAAIGAADVVWAYAGVRSLYDDGARQAAGHRARLRAHPRQNASAWRRC